VEEKKKDASATPIVSDDPEKLAAQAREAVEKNAAELRKPRIPIATEPPTVFRP
jgi:hypothetical protein